MSESNKSVNGMHVPSTHRIVHMVVHHPPAPAVSFIDKVAACHLRAGLLIQEHPVEAFFVYHVAHFFVFLAGVYEI